MKKIMTIAMALSMLFSSLALVSLETDAQDSAKPFLDMNNGFPDSQKLDQSQNTDTGNGVQITDVFWQAQTFTVGITGSLEAVEFYYSIGTGQGTIMVQIYTVTANTPDIPLGTAATVSSSGLPAGMLKVTLNEAIDVQAGEQYAMVLWAGESGWDYVLMYSTSDVYTGGIKLTSTTSGSSWTQESTTDARFQTYVRSRDQLSKVAWHDSGNYALAVTGLDDQVWKFTRETGTWSTLGAIYSGATFSDVIYDDFSGRFYIVGRKSTITPLAIWWTEASGFFDAGAPAVSGKFIAAETCGGVNGYHILAVGENGGGYGYAAWYDGSAWVEVTSGFDLSFLEILRDVTWNRRPDATSKHFAIGTDDEYTTPIYEFGLPGSSTTTRIYSSHGDKLSAMRAISWSPKWNQGAQYDYAIMVGDNDEFYNYGSVYKFDGVNRPEPMITTTDILSDVAWTTDGSTAVIVGENAGGTKGVAYQHSAGTDGLTYMSSDLPSGTGPLNGISFKGYSSPSSGIIVGSVGGLGVYPSATYTGSTITVNTNEPHTYDIDIWETSDGDQISKTNQLLNPETTYTFFAEVNYSVDGVDQFYADGENDVRVLLTAWYDFNGAREATPPDETDENRTVTFRALWTEGAAPGGDAAAMLYPVGSIGTDEVQLASAGLESGPGDHYYVYFNVTLGPQMRAADSGGTWNPSGDNMLNETRPGEWKLDDGSGTAADDSGIYWNDGALENMDNTDWVGGISGDALEFDGVDNLNRVTLPTGPELQPPNSLTLTAWVRLDDTSYEPIINGGGITYGLWVNGGTAQFRLNTNVFQDLSGTTVLDPGRWYYLAATYDGSVMRIYVNGVEDNSLLASGDINYGGFTNGLHIGYYYGNGAVADGIIDEPTIWSRVLSPTEIMDDYLDMVPPSWHIVDPSQIPEPASGRSHRNAGSGSGIWWYGNNVTGGYHNGKRVRGSLVSPTVFLPNTSTWGVVAFSHWFEVDDVFPPATDTMTVSIKNNTDSGWTLLKTWDSGSEAVNDWNQEILPVTGWMGNYVQLNFTFDSVNDINNDYAGWHLDDIIFYTNEVAIVVGEVPTGGGYSVYSTDLGGGIKDINGMKGFAFNDVKGSLNRASSFMAVGDSGVARYWDGGAWYSLTGMDAGDTLTGVTNNGTHFFMVGYDSTNKGVAYYITQSSLNSGSYGVTPIANTPAIRLNDIAAGSGRGIVCGEGYVYELTPTLTWNELQRVDNTVNYTSVAFNVGGTRAVITGNRGSDSFVYTYYSGKKHISQIYDGMNILKGHQLYGASYQPRSSGVIEVILSGKSAFKFTPSALDQFTTVTVKSDYPNIFSVDVNETTNPSTSLLNKQVNVESTFRFYAEVNYSVDSVDQMFDGINNTAIDVIAWYDDNGATEMSPPAEDDQHRTRMFSATWFEGDGGVNLENAILNYPVNSPGTNEFQVAGFNSGPAGGDHWWVSIDVYFGTQTRAADLGGGGSASTNISDPAQSFNDPGSWNFIVRVRDLTYTSVVKEAYEEFGVFAYSSISVAGDPSGNAPPGSSDNYIGNSQVTSSANRPYYVNVSIDDLAEEGGGGSIAASNVKVRSASTLATDVNSEALNMRAFPGSKQNISVWGNTSQPSANWEVAAPGNGTTAHGPWGSDFNGYGATDVEWYVTIPASTGEGTYKSTITFKIGYY